MFVKTLQPTTSREATSCLGKQPAVQRYKSVIRAALCVCTHNLFTNVCRGLSPHHVRKNNLSLAKGDN